MKWTSLFTLLTIAQGIPLRVGRLVERNLLRSNGEEWSTAREQLKKQPIMAKDSSGLSSGVCVLGLSKCVKVSSTLSRGWS